MQQIVLIHIILNDFIYEHVRGTLSIAYIYETWSTCGTMLMFPITALCEICKNKHIAHAGTGRSGLIIISKNPKS